jgi:translation initiation factor 3 subunit B
LTNKAVNGIHWAPNGHNIVLSGLKALNGQLEFFNVDEFEILAAAEHFMATNVEWDPTGAFQWVLQHMDGTRELWKH